MAKSVVWFILPCLLLGLWSTPAAAQKKERTYWSYADGHFENAKGNKWVEKSGTDTYHFVEVDRTPKYVELYDKSRDCTVRLLADRYIVKFGNEAFKKFGDGKWVR